jgi:hypothetical protein
LKLQAFPKLVVDDIEHLFPPKLIGDWKKEAIEEDLVK